MNEATRAVVERMVEALKTCSVLPRQEWLPGGTFWRWAHFDESKVSTAIAEASKLLEQPEAVPEQGREEWIAEMDGLADAVEDLAGIVAHELSTVDDLEKLCAARSKLHAHLRTVPAPSGYEATIATQAAEIEWLRACVKSQSAHIDALQDSCKIAEASERRLRAHIQEAASQQSFYGTGPNGWQKARNLHLAALSPQKEQPNE